MLGKRKATAQIFILGILLAIFVTGTVFLSGQGTGFISPFSVGFTTLSTEKISYASNEPSLNGPAFTLNAVLNGGGESAYGTVSITPQIIEQATGQKILKPFSLSVDSYKERCAYSLSNTTIEYFTVTPPQEISRVFGKTSSVSLSECGKLAQETASTIFVWEKTGYTIGVGDVGTCLLKKSNGYFFDLPTPNYDFEAKGRFMVDSVTTPFTVTNFQGNTNLASFGNVRWLGNLATGSKCPESGSEGIKALYGMFWPPTTIDWSWYSLPENAPNSADVRTCVGGSWGDTTKVSNCVSAYNTRAIRAVRPKSFNSVTYTSGINSNSPGIWNGSGVSNGKYILSATRPYNYPLLQFRIKAETLGIYTPAGKPAIVGVNPNPLNFDSGGRARLTISVKNEGSAQSSVQTWVECSQPVEMEGDRVSQVIQPNQISNLYLTLRGGTQSAQDYTCTIKVCDSQNCQGTTVTSILKGRINPPSVCTNGATRCSPTFPQTETCTNGNWVTKEVCSYKCENNNCIAQTTTTTIPLIVLPDVSTCQWWNVGCLLKEKAASLVVGLIASLILLVVVVRRFPAVLISIWILPAIFVVAFAASILFPWIGIVLLSVELLTFLFLGV